jgi:Sap, sulfolipid-1-addressing protein
VLLQASGLALLASLSPTALLIAAVYLGSARPRLTASFYLVGALAMSAVMGVVLLVLLRSADLSRESERQPRYEVRLGIGIVLLVAGVVISRFKSLTRDPAEEPHGIVYRMAARPALWNAFLVGILVFAPGACFLAALQVIATAQSSLELTLLAVALVVVINVLLVWLPLLLYLVLPGRTTRYLAIFNGWLRAHGRLVLMFVLVTVGAIMIGDGIYGLVT